jgi:hypothetical protein
MNRFLHLNGRSKKPYNRHQPLVEEPTPGSKNLKPLFLCWFFLERKSFLFSKTLEPKIFSYSEKIKKTGTWFSNSEKE